MEKSHMELLGQKMPHILEEIFFHLDRQSIERCSKVCMRWKEILGSDTFNTKWDRLHPKWMRFPGFEVHPTSYILQCHPSE